MDTWVGEGNLPSRKSKMWKQKPPAILQCTAAAGHTRGTKGLVENHSANEPNVADGRQQVDEKSPSAESDLSGGYQGYTPTCHNRPESTSIEKQAPARRNKNM